MTLKALFGATITAVLLGAGAFWSLRLQGASFEDFVAALSFRGEENALICFALAAGALLSAFLAIVSCFAAFRDEDDPEYQTDEYPFGAIPFFTLLSLALFWFALGCGGRQAVSEPGAPEPLVEPEPEPEPLEKPLLEKPPVDEPVVLEEPVIEASPPSPSVAPYSAPWPYQYPLIRNGGYAPSPAVDAYLDDLFPAGDPTGALSGVLCGKAWIAVSGASSEEGPAERNATRARIRAELAAARAAEWVAQAGPACGSPVVLGLDLGQHVETDLNGEAGDEAATAYQRETLFITRDLAPDEAALTPQDALAELTVHLDDPAARGAFLSGRAYLSAPQPFIP